MKKIFALTLSALLLVVPAFSFEWGGLVNDDEYMTFGGDNPFALTHSNSVYLSASIPFNKKGTMSLKAEGMYKFSLNAPGDVSISHTADLDLLKFDANFQTKSGSVVLNAGRFNISDLTGDVFAQASDGLLVKYTSPFFGFSGYAGYTGLINSNVVTMLGADGVAYAPANEVYALAEKFLPFSAVISFPSLIANQSLNFQALGFVDLSGNDVSASRYYATLSLSGPIAGDFYYTALTSFGSVNFENCMNYSNVKASFITPIMVINLGGEYASGNNGFLSPFVTFTSKTAYGVGPSSAQETGFLAPYVNATVSLNGISLFLDAGVKAVFDCSDSEFGYSGLQVDVSATWNIMSDWNLCVKFQDFNQDMLVEVSTAITF